MICAVDSKLGIGKNGKMAWHYSEDFKYFKEYTKNSLCIMGSTTYKDILSFKKVNDGPFLADRLSIVLTSRPHHYDEKNSYSNIKFIDDTANALPDLLYFVVKHDNDKSIIKDYDSVVVVGGKSVYEKFIEAKVISELSVTYVNKEHDCDIFLDELPEWLSGYVHTTDKMLSNECTAKIYNRSDYYETF